MEALLKLAFLIGFTTAYVMVKIVITLKLNEICDSESSISIFFMYFAFTGALLLRLAITWMRRHQ